MWKINEVKKQARKTIKNNMWTLLFVGIIMTFVFGEYRISKDGFSNLKTLESFIKGQEKGEQVEFFDKDNDEVLVNKYVDQIINQSLFGTINSNITDFNQKHNVTKGVFFETFEILTKGQTQLQKLVDSVTDYTTKLKMAEFLTMAIAIGGFVIKIFITNPITVGESRMFLESKNYNKTKIKRLLYAFKKERYWGSVKTIFVRNIYKDLWNFTIIGGIIKYYSYKMVPFIVAENPKIKPNEAITLSRNMMNGNKLKAFYLDLSFIGWHILQYITFGLVGIYVNPYVKATYSELYAKLRKEYKENKKVNYELLNDDLLFESNEHSKYPCEETKKLKIDYNKNYELTSIILFFFTFSFVGWLWEVGLFLFEDGIFVNRGTLYGPWLPIYGTGCTLIILLTKFNCVKKMLKNPLLTFNVNMVVCSIIEYATSWYIEVTQGTRYWDYTGIFMNLNGRICLECALFFGFGSCICVYFVAPFLEKMFQKLTNKVKITICLILIMLFTADSIYAHKYPHTGEGITEQNSSTTQK